MWEVGSGLMDGIFLRVYRLRQGGEKRAMKGMLVVEI